MPELLNSSVSDVLLPVWLFCGEKIEVDNETSELEGFILQLQDNYADCELAGCSPIIGNFSLEILLLHVTLSEIIFSQFFIFLIHMRS